MVLIMSDKTVYVNEDAKAKLSEFWQSNYITNMKRLIPIMAEELANDIIAVNSVKTVSSKSHHRLSLCEKCSQGESGGRL